MASSHRDCLLTLDFMAAESVWLVGRSSISQLCPGRSRNTCFYERVNPAFYESLLKWHSAVKFFTLSFMLVV